MTVPIPSEPEKPTSEVATAGASSAAKAKIEAAYTVAMHRPRDLDTVRVKLLESCNRPGFAAAAMYAKPAGNDRTIKGMSIRFAEEAARMLGNIQCENQTVYDDSTQRIIQVSVTDLETNYTASAQAVIAKTVERKNKTGRVVIDERKNSYGDTVYVVVATEDELFTKQNSVLSKTKRNLLLDMLPADLQEEAREKIENTLRGNANEDPATARRKIADAFAGMGIKPASLKKYLGHDLAESSPSEIAELRDIWQGIKQGETTWSAVMDSKQDAAPSKSAFDKGASNE